VGVREWNFEEGHWAQNGSSNKKLLKTE